MKVAVERDAPYGLYEEELRARLCLGKSISLKELFWLVFRNHLRSP